MTELFLKVVNMSISASWLILAVMIFRFTLKKAPKWINVLMWGIVAVRLICPISIESVMSLIPRTEVIPPNIMLEIPPTIDSNIPIVDNSVNNIISDSNTPAIGDSVNPLQITFAVLATIWIVGVGLLILYTLISYWRLYRQVRGSICLKENIFQSKMVGSPFVLGLIQPKIYLPCKMEKESLDYVIAHEQAHIHRRDHWWKPFGFLLLTVYWFNPLMWIAYILLCRDIELACDEKVINTLGKEKKADYSQALLSCSINQRMIAACPLAFGEVGVKERVKFVLNYKKPAFWVIVLSVITCIIIGVCFLTNPKDSKPIMKSDVIVTCDKDGNETWIENPTVFGTNILRNQIRKIFFLDKLDNAPTDAIDISEEQNKSVLMWVVKENALYNMYIAGKGGIVAPTNSISLFAKYKKLISIDFGNCFDTSQVMDMRFMFEDTSLLSNVDVSGWNTFSVVDMSYMFRGCRTLKRFCANEFDTSNVRNMGSMFLNCSSLISVEISNWNTSSVRDMSFMFDNCMLLKEIDVSDWNTSNVCDMKSMFRHCKALKNIDIRNWNTSNVADMSSMFSECTSLASLEIGNWNTSSVTNMNSMFENCDSLTGVKTSGWNTEKVTNMYRMFRNCNLLADTEVNNWNTSKVTDMRSMFERCIGLTNHPQIPVPEGAKTTMIYYGTEWRIEDVNNPNITYDIEKIEVVTDNGVTESNTWIAGKGTSMKFTVNGDVSKFKFVDIDTHVLYRQFYTIEDDGATICVQPNYLDDESNVGEHTLRVKYEDGEAKITFYIELEKLPPFEGYYKYSTEEEGWNDLSKKEQIEKCHIPQNVLDSMTDEQVIHAVADYPWIEQELPFVKYDFGFPVYAFLYKGRLCDAFQDLLSRDSGRESAIAYIEEKYIRNRADLDLTTKDKCKKLEAFLYVVRYNEIWKQQFTEEEKAIITEAGSIFDTRVTY